MGGRRPKHITDPRNTRKEARSRIWRRREGRQSRERTVAP
jgi:hypothetical protein